MATTLLGALAWSAAGFVLGFCLCWLVVRTPEAPEEVVRVFKLNMSRDNFGRTVLGILILGMGFIGSLQYYRVTSCQSSYNAAVASSLTQRAEAQRVTSAAQIRLLTETLSNDPVASRRAIEAYIKALQDLETVRAATPYPQPASCGDLK